MKTFKSLQEERGEKAYKQAISMGLKYGGFGYWKDPQTNETVYKTENDTLVPVEKEEESELAAKRDEGGAEMAGAMGGGPAGMAGMRSPDGMLMMPGGGQMQPGSGVLGAPEAGLEQVAKERGWDPGPDGDTCVGPEAEQPGEVPGDSFVGRTNFLQWKAGPDGDNMTNVTFGKLREQINQIREEEEQGTLGLSGAGYEEKQPTNMARQRMRKVMGVGSKPATGRTDKEAKSAVDAMRKDHPTVLGNQIASMMKIAQRRKDRTYDDTLDQNQSDKERNERNKDADMWRKVARFPAIKKDADAVKLMNDEARGLVKDPNYSLDIMDAEEIGSGAFGSAYQDAKGNIIKTGGIGPGELAALHAMEKNPRFPTLLNAKFDEPFMHKSSEYNNPQGADNEKRGQGESDYWNPEEQSDFDKKYPTAQGTYAMTAAQGEELGDALYNMDEEMQDKVMRNFWRARGDLHKAGFSHNDMHGGNIFADPDTGDVNILDLGLAKQDKLSALMEGLGGLDYEQGEDYQLTDKLSGSQFTGRMREFADENRSNVEQMMLDSIEGDMTKYDDYDEDSEYSPTFQGLSDRISDMMRGDIRMDQRGLDELREDIPFLQDEGNLDKMIKTLYNEIGNSELADRMSDAFSRRQQDTKLIDAANKIRRSKGQKDINVTNRNVIPPRNMDFDD